MEVRGVTGEMKETNVVVLTKCRIHLHTELYDWRCLDSRIKLVQLLVQGTEFPVQVDQQPVAVHFRLIRRREGCAHRVGVVVEVHVTEGSQGLTQLLDVRSRIELKRKQRKKERKRGISHQIGVCRTAPILVALSSPFRCC